MTTPSPVVPSRSGTAFDSILIILILAFAYLVSSFVARNSDVWQHLAVGRLVASGQYDFAGDPLSYTTEGRSWANHAWLSDWTSYQLFRLAGGAGLVAVKAGLVLVAFGIGASGLRRDRPRWLAALFMIAAVAALSPRATLQPMIVSCVLLALVLRCLQIGGKAYRLIPLLAMAWVNLDGWYLLAPLLATVYWLAQRGRRSIAVPLWLPPATIAACLISPFHIYGLTLPPEVSPSFLSSDLARDPRVAIQSASYFTSNPFAGNHSDSAAFWAYCGLVLSGTIVLIVRRLKAELWEGVVWGLAVALSVWQARLVPICAVVAVSLLARHVQELTPVRAWGRSGRWGTLVVILGCGLVAWNGWLQGTQGRDRSLGWAVYADPSLVRAAETLARWRKDGQLPPDIRVLCTTPDASNTLAWFAVGERGYLDTRWALHAQTGRVHSLNIAEDLGLVRSATGAVGDPEALKRYRVGAILFYDPPPPILASFWTQDSPWRILQIDGRAVWLSAKTERADNLLEPWVPPDRLGFDADRRAFGAEVEPGQHPIRLARHTNWWMPSSTTPFDQSFSSASAATYLNLHLGSNARGPGLPLLAIRAARRSIAENPDDAQAWLILAKAYSVMGATVESSTTPQSGLLTELRSVQRITALAQAIIANPDLEAAHDGLASALTGVGYLDRALMERQSQIAIVRRRGDAQRLALMAPLVAKLEDDVFDRECQFQVQTQKMSGDPLGRARIALGLGLANLGRDILLKSSSDLYGVDGVRLLAGLLISTGQASEAQILLGRNEIRQNPGGLGFQEIQSLTADGQRIVYRIPAYDWYQYLLAAATGIGDARAPIGRLRQNLTRELDGVGGYLNRVSVPVSKQVTAEVGLGATATMLPRVVIDMQRKQLLGPATQAEFLIIERADFAVLEALYAIEEGELTSASILFETALEDYARKSGLRVAPAKALAELYRKPLVEFGR